MISWFILVFNKIVFYLNIKDYHELWNMWWAMEYGSCMLDNMYLMTISVHWVRKYRVRGVQRSWARYEWWGNASLKNDTGPLVGTFKKPGVVHLSASVGQLSDYLLGSFHRLPVEKGVKESSSCQPQELLWNYQQPWMWPWLSLLKRNDFKTNVNFNELFLVF